MIPYSVQTSKELHLYIPQVPETPPEAVEILLEERRIDDIELQSILEQPVLKFRPGKSALLSDVASRVPLHPDRVLERFAVQIAHGTYWNPGISAIIACALVHPAGVLPLNGQQVPDGSQYLHIIHTPCE